MHLRFQLALAHASVPDCSAQVPARNLIAQTHGRLSTVWAWVPMCVLNLQVAWFGWGLSMHDLAAHWYSSSTFLGAASPHGCADGISGKDTINVALTVASV